MTEHTASPEPARPAGPSATDRWSGRALAAGVRIGGLLIAILIVIVIFTVLSKPNTFLTVTNALGIMRSMSTIAIVALGLTLVIVVGEIDLSFGFVYGLASISSAWPGSSGAGRSGPPSSWPSWQRPAWAPSTPSW